MPPGLGENEGKCKRNMGRGIPRTEGGRPRAACFVMVGEEEGDCRQQRNRKAAGSGRSPGQGGKKALLRSKSKLR